MLRSATKADLQKKMEAMGIVKTPSQWRTTKKRLLMKEAIAKLLPLVKGSKNDDIPRFQKLWKTLAELTNLLRDGLQVCLLLLLWSTSNISN